MTVLVVVTRQGRETAAAVTRALADRGDVVCRAEDDADALVDLEPARDRHLDLVVVAADGDVDAGHRVCRSVRAATTAPLCLVSSSRREADELLAFARGCDDYVATSASVEVLRARLEGLAARGGRRRTERVLAFGDVRVDPHLRTVTVAGSAVALTRIEFDLLQALVTDQRRVLSRGELLGIGWGAHQPCDHVLDVHMSRLRRKVLQAGGPKIGESVPGVGYRVGALERSPTPAGHAVPTPA